MTVASKQTADLEIRPDIKVPRYMQVYSTLQNWISQGHYSPGAKIEPESQLCEMFSVSRITIRKALEMLANEKLVESVQGKGTFVTRTLGESAVRGDMDERIQRARNMARSSQLRQFSKQTEPANSEVARDLKIEPGEPVQKVTYIRVVRGINMGMVESHHPVSLNIDVRKQDFGENSMFTILQDKGVKLAGIDHLIGASLADADIARALDINVGAPVVRIKLVMLDTSHQPLQRVIAYFRADKYEHHMFLARGGQEST